MKKESVRKIKIIMGGNDMQFYIEGYMGGHGIPTQSMNKYPHIKLVTDDFDDFGHQTLFRMYYRAKEHNPYTFIGKIKILHVEDKITRYKIPHAFTELDKNFCSLGQNIEYYFAMKKLNKPNYELGENILKVLNDIAFNPHIKDKFPNQVGIEDSLLRESGAYHAFNMGHSAYYGMSSHIDKRVAFTYTYEKASDKKVFFEFNDDIQLPNRINVVVGKNGTGKTKMLSSLASYLSGRSKLNNELEVDVRPEFSRYIAISYSAFDNFEKPFMENYNKRGIVQERQYIIDAIKRQQNKCQRRHEVDCDFNTLFLYFSELLNKIDEFEKTENFTGYFERLLDGVEAQEYDMFEDQVGSYVYCGLLHENRLISEEEMYMKLKENLVEINRMQRLDVWKSIMRSIFDGTEDLIRAFPNELLYKGDINKDGFTALSSGQKIISHIFTQVVASITEDSLLLIDEPEIHLHPNAISSFMRMLNQLLEKFNSFAIISTHSPIVLQEIPAKYVRVFDNNVFYDTKLWEECFGDNISSIIKNVFNVRPDESNFKTFFLQKKEEGFSKERLERLFNNNLSMNAELYLNLLYGDE